MLKVGPRTERGKGLVLNKYLLQTELLETILMLLAN